MMGERVGLEVSLAVSEAVKLSRAEVIAAYPITPQTHIVEELSQMVADGELDAEYIMVESEHSAMSACCGASAVGARTFTATASQGLALMHEVLFIASGLRLPIVMVVANRALSAPLSIWGDQSDVMSERDSGWIQLFAETGQEALDLTIQAFKITEDKRVLLPAEVNIDGFTLSHVVEPIEMPGQEEVDSFLPPYEPQVILEIWDEFERKFGRRYRPIEHYKTEGAEILINMAGAMSGTARMAVDMMREKGKKVGLARTRLWRPYPFDEIRSAVKGAKAVAVVDRALSFGGQGGPMCSELRSALYPLAEKPVVTSYIAGLGGRDITIENFQTIVEDTEDVLEGGPREEYKMIGVRE